MAGNNRDDFSARTKEQAAKRVGYKCSCPECGITTVGASLESNDKVANIGVAAHIYAAAPGGPRYDSNMTREKRKSIENCIWLCQTHAHLIDSDMRTYTPELLRKWKSDAEMASAKALANGDGNFFDKYLQEYGEDTNTISNLLDQFIDDGNYNRMFELLSTYHHINSENLEELVLRYWVVYDVYCNHSKLDQDISKYTELKCRAGINKIIELFCSFLMSDYLQKVIPYCTDSELRQIGEYIVNGEIKEHLIITKKENAKLIPQKYAELYNKMATWLIYKEQLFGMVDVEGNPYKLYEKGVFYKIQCIMFNLRNKCFFYELTSDTAIEVKSATHDIIESINKVNLLDNCFKIEIWKFLLFYQLNCGDFSSTYSMCPQDIRENFEIRELYYLSYIKDKQWEFIEAEELVQFARENKNYTIIHDYLISNSVEYSVDFLMDHQFLYKVDCIFIYLILIVYSKSNVIQQPIEFLNKFKEQYTDCFLYHCLKARFQKQGDSDYEIQWIKNNMSKIKVGDIPLLITVLEDNKEWGLLKELTKLALPFKFLLQIADALTADEESYFRLIEIYDKLIDSGYKKQRLLLAKGDVCVKTGKLNEAFQCYQSEYDTFHTKEALLALLALRYEANQFVEDHYFDDAKKINTANMQNVVAAYYMRIGKKQEANIYFLRSLLLDDSLHESLNGYFLSADNATESKDIAKDIREGVVCILRNAKQTLRVALHDAKILSGIEPNGFSECLHFSMEDPCVSSWRWKIVGEKVVFYNEEYKIQTITPAQIVFSQYAIKMLQHSKNFKMIHAQSGEEMLEQIASILKETSDTLANKIENYNSMQIRFPLSIFANLVGKQRLESLQYLLYGNSQRYRNNKNYVELDENIGLILSYECIVIASYLDILGEIMQKYKIVCTKQVESQLLSDINELLDDTTDEKRTGFLTMYSDRPTYIEHTNDDRRSRFEYLTKLKSDLQSIEIIEGSDWNFEDRKFVQDLSQHKAYCECSCLGTAQATKYTLVSDDEFVYSLAKLCQYPTIGLCNLLAQSNLSCERLLECSKKMSQLNFATYITPAMYKAIVNDIKRNKDSHGADALANWLSTDTDNIPTEFHHFQIDQLCRQVLQAENLELDSDDITFLARYAIIHREYFFPGTIQRLLEDEYTGSETE